MKYLEVVRNYWKEGVGIGLLLLVIFTYIDFQMKLNEYETINQNLINRIANDTQIQQVITDKFTKLYERNVKIENDFKTVLTDNKNLKNYIKDQKGELEFLMKKNTEITLENVTLRGILRKDSLGNEYATFDSTTEYYSIQTEVGLKPAPFMKINEISFMDSSYIGIISQDSGTVKGFITHSNPYVFEKSAEFSIPVKNSYIEKDRAWTDYLIGLALIVLTYGASKL